MATFFPLGVVAVFFIFFPYLFRDLTALHFQPGIRRIVYLCNEDWFNFVIGVSAVGFGDQLKATQRYRL